MTATTTPNFNKLVAEAILEQLGGAQFVAMTGAKRFAVDGAGLSFQLPGRAGFVKHGICAVSIKLTANDVYHVSFYAGRGAGIRLYSENAGIYAGDLRRVFTYMTGLAVSL
jgi:hypothetical protein